MRSWSRRPRIVVRDRLSLGLWSLHGEQRLVYMLVWAVSIIQSLTRCRLGSRLAMRLAIKVIQPVLARGIDVDATTEARQP